MFFFLLQCQNCYINHTSQYLAILHFLKDLSNLHHRQNSSPTGQGFETFFWKIQQPNKISKQKVLSIHKTVINRIKVQKQFLLFKRKDNAQTKLLSKRIKINVNYGDMEQYIQLHSAASVISDGTCLHFFCTGGLKRYLVNKCLKHCIPFIIETPLCFIPIKL